MDGEEERPMRGQKGTGEGLTLGYQRSAVSLSFSICMIGDTTRDAAYGFRRFLALSPGLGLDLGLSYGGCGGTRALVNEGGFVAFSCQRAHDRNGGEEGAGYGRVDELTNCRPEVLKGQ